MKKFMILFFMACSFGVMAQGIGDIGAIIDLIRNVDTSSPEAILATWISAYTVIMPLALMVIHKFWDSPNTSTIRLRSVIISVFVLVVGVLILGASPQAILSAGIAFITSQSFYKDFIKVFGFSSPKPATFVKEAI